MQEELVTLPGLSGPATITIDRWGIPHIVAANRADLFFAQGLTSPGIVCGKSIFGANAA